MRRRAVVLGGYGLIGRACVVALAQAGFCVTGVGRSAARAAQVADAEAWHILDLARCSDAQLAEALAGADVVVNAAGALQEGPSDDLGRIHAHLPAQLAAVLAGRAVRLIQISAAGVRDDHPTAFFRTKWLGDLALRAHADHVILRPTLVVSPDAYGGTALLRAAAALPIGVKVFGDAPMMAVHVRDVAGAVVVAAQRQVAAGTVADLTAPEPDTLWSLTKKLRCWLGAPAWRWRVAMPDWAIWPVGWAADLAGRFGWRSPMRSTALRVLAEGVRGDPDAWVAAGGTACRSLADVWGAHPATGPDRLHARVYLLIPMAVSVLAVFWCVSGVIGLTQVEAAQMVLTSRGVPEDLARGFVRLGSVVDVALGLAVLWRAWARAALLGMVLVGGGYMLGALVLAPDLWADPLGAMVKVVPATLAALLARAMVEPR